MATGLQISAVCKCVHTGRTAAGYVWSDSQEPDFCCLVSQCQGNQRRLLPLLGPRKTCRLSVRNSSDPALLNSRPRVCRIHSHQPLATSVPAPHHPSPVSRQSPTLFLSSSHTVKSPVSQTSPPQREPGWVTSLVLELSLPPAPWW